MLVPPSFFLVGAPKCATGTIDATLATHPELFLASKDLHFFAPDLPTSQRRLTAGDYEALFANAKPGTRRGESSVGYLYSMVAARAIRERAPEASIIIALRNPLDAVPSLHQHCVYYGIEEIENLEAALAAEDDRAAGRRLPRRCAHPWMLRYTDVYRFAPQIRRYFDTFGREQCRVVMYDDFVTDRRTTINALTEFLGVAELAEIADLRHNGSRQPRSRTVSALLTDPPAPVRRVVRGMTPQRLRRAVADGVLAANTAGARRPVVVPAVRELLTAKFAGDLAELSELLEADLSHWMEGVPA